MAGAAKVTIKEIDLSTRVASFEGVYGAIVVQAKKGASDRPQLVTSDTQFLSVFTPDSKVEVGYDLAYFSALSYLERSNKLWVKRVINGATFSGATVFATGLSVAATFDAAIAGVTGNVELSADDAGIKGNLILITGDGILDLDALVLAWNVANPTNTVSVDSANGADVPNDLEAMQLAGGLGNAPLPNATGIIDPTAYVFGGSESLLLYGANEGAWGDQIGYTITTVVDDPDLIEVNSFLIEVYKSSNLATPVESWLVSRVLGQKDGRGLNMYVEDVLESSNYLRAISNDLIAETTLPESQSEIQFLNDGDDGVTITSGNMVSAADDFANKAEVSVTLLMDGGFAVPAYAIALDTIAQNRQDCVAILSTPFADEAAASYLNDIVDYRKTDLNLNSSYSALYTPHLQILDKFNDRNIWISPDGHICGSISFTANSFEIWFPPAGFRRGILNVLDTRRRFSDGELDALYTAGINPIRFIPGKGIVVWGQKTLQARQSALDRLNVRLLLIVIEPAIKELLENFLFEFNDQATRTVIETKLETYLQTIKARRGITDFDVVSDDSNNSPDDIDSNRLNVDVFIKPNRSIEDIPVRIVITPSNISFAEAASSI